MSLMIASIRTARRAAVTAPPLVQRLRLLRKHEEGGHHPGGGREYEIGVPHCSSTIATAPTVGTLRFALWNYRCGSRYWRCYL